MWIDLSQRHDGFNVLNTLVLSFKKEQKKIQSSIPILSLPAASKNRPPFVIAGRQRILEVADSHEMEKPEFIHQEAQQPFFTDHDNNFDIKMQSGPKNASKPFNECVVDLKRICRFCLNECEAANAIRIAWDAWEHSKLSQLYEEITKAEVRFEFSIIYEV